MYEYAPKSKKTKEKVVLGLTLVLAAACFGVSQIEQIPYPAIYQLLMIFSLVGTVMITARCLMRNYIYRVEPRENGGEGDLPDFTITEYYGNRVTVVCRISVGDIRGITPVTKKNRDAISAMQKKKRAYYYTGELQSANAYVLTVEQDEDEFFLRICADEGLLQALKTYGQQFLAD